MKLEYDDDMVDFTDDPEYLNDYLWYKNYPKELEKYTLHTHDFSKPAFKTGKKATIFDMVHSKHPYTGETRIDTEPREIDIMEYPESEDVDLVDNSDGHYVFGERILHPITGDLLHKEFSDVTPGSIRKLIAAGLEQIPLIPKSQLEKYRDMYNNMYKGLPNRNILNALKSSKY